MVKKAHYKVKLATYMTVVFPACLAAKITTRPGQVGACNGYILEGDELETLLNTRQDLRLSMEMKVEKQ